MNKVFKSLITAILTLISFNIVSNEAHAVANIPDANLMQCVKDTLGITTTPTIAQMNDYKHGFTCSDKNVVNVEGVEHFKNVDRLDLSQNLIVDVSSLDLSDFSNLIIFDLSGNRIVDVSGLNISGIQKLESLQLGGNRIVDIRGLNLNNLPNLNLISLSNNRITDINSLDLSGLTNLSWLSISQNRIVDVSDLDLSELENLTLLNLSDNYINNANELDLSKNPKLTSLSLQFNSISDLKGLDFRNNSKLVSLSLANNLISDLEELDLTVLPNLKLLYLWGNQISDLSKLDFSNLSNLSLLQLGNNQISDLSNVDWSGLTSLNTLVLQEQEIILPNKVVDTPSYTIDLPIKDGNGNLISYSNNQPLALNVGATGLVTAEWYTDSVNINGMVFDTVFSGVVEQNVTRIDPVAFNGTGFAVKLADVKNLDEATSMIESNISSSYNGVDITSNITVDATQLNNIQTTDEVGVYPLTFTITHLGVVKSLELQVFVYSDDAVVDNSLIIEATNYKVHIDEISNHNPLIESKAVAFDMSNGILVNVDIEAESLSNLMNANEAKRYEVEYIASNGSEKIKKIAFAFVVDDEVIIDNGKVLYVDADKIEINDKEALRLSLEDLVKLTNAHAYEIVSGKKLDVGLKDQVSLELVQTGDEGEYTVVLKANPERAVTVVVTSSPESSLIGTGNISYVLYIILIVAVIIFVRKRVVNKV